MLLPGRAVLVRGGLAVSASGFGVGADGDDDGSVPFLRRRFRSHLVNGGDADVGTLFDHGRQDVLASGGADCDGYG